jgi:Flp pilus assembly protein CpaB
MAYRLRNITIALVLALVAALLTTFYVSNYKKNVQQGESDVPVYVATKDIPAGTAASDVLTGGYVDTVQVDKRNLAPGAAWKEDQLDGLVAVEPVYAGEQLTTRRFRPLAEKGARGELTGNLRAFQVPGDKHQLLAGTLKEGDKIDVVANIKYKLGERDLVASRVVLRDVLVLKPAPSEESTSAKLTGGGPAGSAIAVLLAVTDTQAAKLLFVLKNGDWSLQLRPTNDAADSPESVETPLSVLGDGLRPTQRHQLIGGGSSE